jgi:chemotaxis regulatin CheY-phosphate phosphatase CheZ
MTATDQAVNPVEQSQPSPVRRVSALQDARERLSDYAATGIEPTDARHLIALVLSALDGTEDYAESVSVGVRDLLDNLDAVDITGNGRAVEAVGAAIYSLRRTIAS